jgi:hypothetical protein
MPAAIPPDAARQPDGGPSRVLQRSWMYPILALVWLGMGSVFEKSGAHFGPGFLWGLIWGWTLPALALLALVLVAIDVRRLLRQSAAASRVRLALWLLVLAGLMLVFSGADRALFR